METQQLIISGSILFALLIATILTYRHRKRKAIIQSMHDEWDSLKANILKPKYNGYTTNKRDSFYEPKIAMYTVTIESLNGPQMTFAHDNFTATEALTLAFKYDKEHDIDVLPEEHQKKMLEICKHYDMIGWKQWGEDPSKGGKDNTPISMEIKVSSCCSTPLPIIASK